MKKILTFLFAALLSAAAFSQNETKMHPAQLLQAGATNGQALVFNTVTGEWEPFSISTGTDDQTVDEFQISSNTLSISLESDGEAAQTVDLSPYLDNTDAQDLSLSSNTLSLTGDASTVDLSGYLDNTDDQTVDQFDITSNTLSLSLEADGEAAKTVNLAPYLDNTDDQIVDAFSISSNTLSLSLENDGVAANTVDLSPYLDNTDTQDLGYTESTGVLTLVDGGSVTVRVSSQYTEEEFLNLTTGNTITISGSLPTDRDGVLVLRGGIMQREGATADFTVSGSVITFGARDFEDGETVLVKYPN